MCQTSRDPVWWETLQGGSIAQGPGNSPAISLVNHVEVLQSGGDVMGAHACGSANCLDANVPLMVVAEVF